MGVERQTLAIIESAFVHVLDRLRWEQSAFNIIDKTFIAVGSPNTTTKPVCYCVACEDDQPSTTVRVLKERATEGDWGASRFTAQKYGLKSREPSI
jgi:hypothetical protein